jgi:hypothetical protein
MQALVSLNRGGVIAVFPERSLPVFALIVFLFGAAGD